MQNADVCWDSRQSTPFYKYKEINWPCPTMFLDCTHFSFNWLLLQVDGRWFNWYRRRALKLSKEASHYGTKWENMCQNKTARSADCILHWGTWQCIDFSSMTDDASVEAVVQYVYWLMYNHARKRIVSHIFRLNEWIDRIQRFTSPLFSVFVVWVRNNTIIFLIFQIFSNIVAEPNCKAHSLILKLYCLLTEVISHVLFFCKQNLTVKATFTHFRLYVERGNSQKWVIVACP